MVGRKISGKKGAPARAKRKVASDLTMGEHALAILEELETIGEDFLKKISELLRGLRKVANSGPDAEVKAVVETAAKSAKGAANEPALKGKARAATATRSKQKMAAEKVATRKPAPKRKSGSASAAGSSARRKQTRKL